MPTASGIPEEFLDELYAIPGNRVALCYLIEEFNKGEVTLLAGDGIPASVGYKPWFAFLENLRREIGLVQTTSPKLYLDVAEQAGELDFADASRRSTASRLPIR